MISERPNDEIISELRRQSKMLKILIGMIWIVILLLMGILSEELLPLGLLISFIVGLGLALDDGTSWRKPID